MNPEPYNGRAVGPAKYTETTVAERAARDFLLGELWKDNRLIAAGYYALLTIAKRATRGLGIPGQSPKEVRLWKEYLAKLMLLQWRLKIIDFNIRHFGRLFYFHIVDQLREFHSSRPIEATCCICLKTFNPKRKDARTCSDACRAVLSRHPERALPVKAPIRSLVKGGLLFVGTCNSLNAVHEAQEGARLYPTAGNRAYASYLLRQSQTPEGIEHVTDTTE